MAPLEMPLNVKPNNLIKKLNFITFESVNIHCRETETRFHHSYFSSAPPRDLRSLSSPGFKPISGVSGCSLCVTLRLPSELLIHLPKMTVTDLSAKQSICISFAFSSAEDVGKVSEREK